MCPCLTHIWAGQHITLQHRMFRSSIGNPEERGFKMWKHNCISYKVDYAYLVQGGRDCLVQAGLHLCLGLLFLSDRSVIVYILVQKVHCKASFLHTQNKYIFYRFFFFFILLFGFQVIVLWPERMETYFGVNKSLMTEWLAYLTLDFQYYVAGALI